MYHSQLKGTILLLITALIWGAAFVAQSVGMDYIGPFTFSAARDVIAIIVLIPVCPFIGKQQDDGNQ
uniref:EamA family transporter n=1 Tax=Megasphaera sp. TaxID=2023260 RepID=UPI00307A9411